MLRMLLRLLKILSTVSGSLLDPNSVAMIDCLMSGGRINGSDWLTAS